MIPAKIRQYLAEDRFMTRCVHDYLNETDECEGRIEWEHCFTFAGKQVQEKWSIVPCCTYHHRGNGLIKDYNRYIGLLRGLELLPEIMKKYPKKNWQQELNYLENKYGERTQKDKISQVPKM